MHIMTIMSRNFKEKSFVQQVLYCLDAVQQIDTSEDGVNLVS